MLVDESKCHSHNRLLGAFSVEELVILKVRKAVKSGRKCLLLGAATQSK